MEPETLALLGLADGRDPEETRDDLAASLQVSVDCDSYAAFPRRVHMIDMCIVYPICIHVLQLHQVDAGKGGGEAQAKDYFTHLQALNLAEQVIMFDFETPVGNPE